MRWIVVGIMLGYLVASGHSADVSTPVGGAGEPLPRIAVESGRFVERPSGGRFTPRGFNYIRLRPRWHGTFAPKRYDAKQAEAMFVHLRQGGFNVVRVFIDPDVREGIVEFPGAEGFSKRYMANFLDFLSRASRHRVHVIPSLLYLPPCKPYNQAVGRERRRFHVGNEMYFDERYAKAKSQFVADFAAAIKAHDARLLTAVFAYELDNETHFVADAEPFSRGSGKYVGPGGATYELAREGDLQRLADDAVTRWADACVTAVRRVDPDAMVSVNVFTFAAVGRSGPGALRRDVTRDRRFPARPLAVVRTKLSYLDIHFYPFDEGTLDRDLASIEFDALRRACRARGMPLIMGEFGAFKKSYPQLTAAAEAMKRHLKRVRALGFQGFCYWTYDTDEQPFLWNARSGRGEIFDVVRSASGWGQAPTSGPTAPNAAGPTKGPTGRKRP